jgi:hypothetical protein
VGASLFFRNEGEHSFPTATKEFQRSSNCLAPLVLGAAHDIKFHNDYLRAYDDGSRDAVVGSMDIEGWTGW